MGKYVRVPKDSIDKDTGPLIHETDVVVVTAGVHRGKVGYWDDNASGEDCIIYFGIPCCDDREYVIKASKLRRADDEERAKYFENRQLLSNDPKLQASFTLQKLNQKG